jgi:voltage-gated potassium channel
MSEKSNKQKKVSPVDSGIARVSRLRSLLQDLRKEKLFSLLLIFFGVVVIGGLLVFIAELLTNRENEALITNPLESIWWSIVTLTTVGYGDFSPVSWTGRIIAVLMMMSGVVLTSILSGTIASIYVDRKIREGRGLEEINFKSHIIICGWNRYALRFLQALFVRFEEKDIPDIALVNEMTPEEYEQVKIKFPQQEIRYIRGDATNESVLKRAHAQHAASCYLIPDESGGKDLLRSDDKTILSALAMKSVNPNIPITAQIVNEDNETHLQRAQVEEVLVNGEFTDLLMAGSQQGVGFSRLARGLFDPSSKKSIHLRTIPSALIGKSFKELVDYFHNLDASIVIGILSEEKSMGLDDILSEDSAGIDAFIKRKFQEADISLEEQQESTFNVNIAPDENYLITEEDSAFVIGGNHA